MNFLKENWWNIANIIVLIAIYIANSEGNMAVELLAGLWIFVTAAYSAFKWFTKK